MALCFVMAGCCTFTGSSCAVQTLKAEQLFAGVQCGGQGQTVLVHWIADESNYHDLQENFSAGTIGGKLSQNLPQVDFSTHGVLMVGMGEKPTAGYSLSLGAQEVEVDKGVALIHLSWQEPPVGAILAQVVTSPCVFLRLPKADFSKVRIMDQNSKVKAEVMISFTK